MGSMIEPRTWVSRWLYGALFCAVVVGVVGLVGGFSVGTVCGDMLGNVHGDGVACDPVADATAFNTSLQAVVFLGGVVVAVWHRKPSREIGWGLLTLSLAGFAAASMYAGSY